MSRTYRLRIRESITRVVHVEDHVEAALELLPVLAPERLSELLAEELARRGFTRAGGDMTRTEDDGTEVRVALAEGRISVRAQAEAEIARAVDKEKLVAQERRHQAEADLRAQTRRALEEDIAREGEQRRRALTARLEAKTRELQRELDEVSARVTAAALKERAAQLGEIESVHEGEDGSLTIKVRV
jgi:hypothetical protein